MAVTRPQTQPEVAAEFATDLADAVLYAKEHAAEAPQSGAIYGGVAGGMTDEADEFIRMVMADMLDGAVRRSRQVTGGGAGGRRRPVDWIAGCLAAQAASTPTWPGWTTRRRDGPACCRVGASAMC